MEQIIAQLDRLVPVHKVTDLTALGEHVERELALVKVAGVGLVYRILPGSPALSRRNADYRGLEAGACRGCIEAR